MGKDVTSNGCLVESRMKGSDSMMTQNSMLARTQDDDESKFLESQRKSLQKA
jgi:hypothetical protein